MSAFSNAVEITNQIRLEYIRARTKHRPMVSAHEGYAVIKEELDELWDEVKTKKFDPERARVECIQIAAMALAFANEVCDKAHLEVISQPKPEDYAPPREEPDYAPRRHFGAC